MSKLSTSIVTRIKQGKHAPKPSWIFRLQRGAIWTLVSISVIAAAIFFGSAIAELITAEWILAPRWPGETLGFVRDTVTWLWVGGFVVAIMSSILFVRLTRHGYRYGISLIGALVALTTIATGCFLLPTGLPERIHDWHDEFMPPRIEAMRFHAPTEGRLMGEITAFSSEGANLTDLDGAEWELWFFSPTPPLTSGDLVMTFGEPIDTTTFGVFAIRPVPPHYPVQESPRPIRIYR